MYSAFFVHRLSSFCGVYSVRYSNFYAAFELIDPAARAASKEISAGAWFACEDICKRNGLNYGLVRTDIMTLRASVAGLCDNEIASAKRNLLKWYHDGKASEWPHLKAYARVVFVMAWETVLAESLFSYLKINKSGHRSVLSNASMDAIWQLHGTTFAVDRTACAFTFPRLDSQRILEHAVTF